VYNIKYKGYNEQYLVGKKRGVSEELPKSARRTKEIGLYVIEKWGYMKSMNKRRDNTCLFFAGRSGDVLIAIDVIVVLLRTAMLWFGCGGHVLKTPQPPFRKGGSLF